MSFQSKRWPVSLLNNEQMSNWLGVEHQPVKFMCFFSKKQTIHPRFPFRWNNRATIGVVFPGTQKAYLRPTFQSEFNVFNGYSQPTTPFPQYSPFKRNSWPYDIFSVLGLNPLVISP